MPLKARRERRTNKRTDRQTKWFLSGHLPLWHHKNMIYFTYDCPELIYTYVMKFKISDETGSIIAYFYRWLSGVDIHLCHEIQNQRWNWLHYCLPLERRCGELSVIVIIIRNWSDCLYVHLFIRAVQYYWCTGILQYFGFQYVLQYVFPYCNTYCVLSLSFLLLFFFL